MIRSNSLRPVPVHYKSISRLDFFELRIPRNTNGVRINTNLRLQRFVAIQSTEGKPKFLEEKLRRDAKKEARWRGRVVVVVSSLWKRFLVRSKTATVVAMMLMVVMVLLVEVVVVVVVVVEVQGGLSLPPVEKQGCYLAGGRPSSNINIRLLVNASASYWRYVSQ
ncbi:hypothetical protein M0802_007289 [Mischocyttarus mexicanus]|nr:hypothetical protein M0802_007289 [Mischocyttarus mexicanus]